MSTMFAFVLALCCVPALGVLIVVSAIAWFLRPVRSVSATQPVDYEHWRNDD